MKPNEIVRDVRTNDGERRQFGGCSLHIGACVFVLVFGACTQEVGGSGSVDTDHPIDRLLIPRLHALGLEAREAPAAEYCRRLTIDLWGRIPSGEELAACVALPDAGARVDAAMASPLYLRTARRAWGEILHYNNFYGWSDEIVDLDALVGQLYAGDVSYGEFAGKVAVDPGFLGLHQGDEWAAALWSVFLGRPARADEIAGFRPLARALYPRYFCEGHIYWNAKLALEDEGLDPATVMVGILESCDDFARTDWAVDYCFCDAPGCTSDVLGRAISFVGSCPEPGDPYDSANFFRIDPRAPGLDDLCPDGVHRPDCRDQETQFDGIALYPLEELAVLDDVGRAQLDQVGEALAARGDFWEAAVDRELRRLTGWWQTSFRHPDTDLPDVRRLLADRLRQDGNLRDIDRLILTSQLYVAPADLPEGHAELPDFALGPTKLMAAETWLDSAAAAVGETSGLCDFRWVTGEGYYETSLIDYTLAEEPPESNFYDGRFYEEAYYDFAIRLGGCNAEQRRPELSNVGLAFSEHELVGSLCAYGAGVVPEGWDGDLGTAARHVVKNVLGRELADDEAATLVGDMQACLAAGGQDGCADGEAAVRWLCARALESAEFSTY